jgi:hypothetical protein
MSSARNLRKKIFMENLRINNFGHTPKTIKNDEISERKEIKTHRMRFFKEVWGII